MATYNRSNVLPYSIASALNQTCSNIEILVIGDGCTDDSEKVVNDMADDRVRWIGLPENCGHQSGPNNVGLSEARGKYIAYLGHDDLWLPHHCHCKCMTSSSLRNSITSPLTIFLRRRVSISPFTDT